MERTASCHCGKLKVEAIGDPKHIVMCHCEDCQRRTGSSYHLGAWYPEANVKIVGDSKRYVRKADSGSNVELFFCPNCGTNIYFKVPGLLPNMIGIAVGCFADPDFPAPEMSVFGKRRHRWAQVPKGVPAYEEWIESEQK